MKTRFARLVVIRAWWFLLLAFPVLLLASDADLAALRANAEKGNAIAQYNLGLAYSTGAAVPKDTIEAYVWLRLATENGATGKALGVLMGEMSPGDLAAGKLRLDERRRAMAVRSSGDRGAPSISLTELPPPTPAAPAPANPAPAKQAAGPAVDSSGTLEKDLAALRDDKMKLSQEIALARKECESLKAAATDERGKLEATISGQTQKIAALSAELEAAHKGLAAAQTGHSQGNKLAAELDAARKELAAAQKECDRVKTAAADDHGRLDATISGQPQKLAALSAELEASHKGLTAAQTDHSQGNKLAVELAAARKELAAARKTGAESTEQLQKLADDQRGINRQLAEAQSTIERLKHENADLQAERSTLTARLNTPAPATASPVPTVAPVAAVPAEDVARLKSDLARAEQTVEMTVRSFTLLREENEKLKAQLEQAGAEHAVANPKVATP